MKLLSKFPELHSCASDPRTRFYVRPRRVVRTVGNVVGAQELLKDRIGQISFDTASCCVLKNGSDGERASVLVDLGREIHGSVRLLVVGTNPVRAKVNIRFGESVTEAITPTPEKGSTNDHANRDVTIELPNWSGMETNESGFRFVNIELVDANAEVKLKALEGVLIVRDIEYVGSFECSDARVNEIFNTAAYTAHLNMQEYMWDGIKRDRLVWIGDMHPEVMTICSVFGDNEVVPRSLDSVRDITPLGSWMNNASSYSIWWLMCHYDYYMQNGKLPYLEEQHEYLVGLMELLASLVDEEGSEQLPHWRFLDWPSHEDKDALHAGLQGLLALGLTYGAKLLTVLGEAELAAKCVATVELMKKHVPTTEWKQASALLALSGVADAGEINEKVLLPGRGFGYSTFYSYYILSAKAKAGDTARALEDMKQYYGGMLDLGATTFWEDFDLKWTLDENGNYDANRIDEIVPDGGKDIHADFGKNCYVGLRHSFCHGWSSGPTTFLMRHVLGVKVLEPGSKRLEVKPSLCGLEYVKGTYPTPYGAVAIYADKDGVKIDAPAGVEIVR